MDIKDALTILNIEDNISLNRLKNIFRDLVKSNHPDVAKEKDKKIQDIIEAYNFLKNYLENYEFTVSSLINYENLEEKTFNRFKNDWLGGSNFNER